VTLVSPEGGDGVYGVPMMDSSRGMGSECVCVCSLFRTANSEQ
jgi:hypothetical protein